MTKTTCLKFKKCGREPGGIKSHERGVCPAAALNERDGINGGKNAGRICWAVCGTFCGGKIQGTFAQKLTNCIDCDFYQLVCREEGREFEIY